VVPFSGGEHLAGALPGARFVALDGGFHLPDVHDLDPIVRAVTEFAGVAVPGSRPAVEEAR
jgi:hypothetical protein